MKVLAIDPGYDRIGIAVLDNEDGKERVLFSTCLTTNKTATLSERLGVVGTTVSSLLAEHRPDYLAIETLFFSKNTKTALAVAEARGVILYVAALATIPIYECNPTTIKLATTGYGKSDKAAVIAMIKRLVTNAPMTALDDEYDAIAVGVTCLAEVGRGR